MPATPHRQRILYLLAGLIVGAIATSMVWAANGGSADVRVAGRILEDGRVEIGLQQRLSDDSGWGEVERPELRYLAPDSERGPWHFSSVLEVVVAETASAEEETVPAEEEAEESDADTDTTSAAESENEPFDGATVGDSDADGSSGSQIIDFGPFIFVGTPTGSRPFTDETLFCVITHGNPGDFFWYQVYSAFADSQMWNDITLRAEMYEAGADQAAGVDQCVEDGAAAIATTLADADALEPALERAQDAGVRLLTFNSGADRATAAGAVAHVALNEEEVGRIAAAEFEMRDVSGDLLCIVHEPTNRGLEQRCDALEESYDGGEVHRLRLPESDTDAVSTISDAVTDDVGGAIALNANTAYDMAAAISEAHPDIVLAAVSADFPRPMAMLATDSLDFVLWSHALEQGYHAITALLFAHGTPFSPDTGLFAAATQITIHPSVITKAQVERLREQGNAFGETLPAWLRALELAIEVEIAGPVEPDEPGSTPADTEGESE